MTKLEFFYRNTTVAVVELKTFEIDEAKNIADKLTVKFDQWVLTSETMKLRYQWFATNAKRPKVKWKTVLREPKASVAA